MFLLHLQVYKSMHVHPQGGINLWNPLPLDVVLDYSPEGFQKGLNVFMEDKFVNGYWSRWLASPPVSEGCMSPDTSCCVGVDRQWGKALGSCIHRLLVCLLSGLR